jgi:hypothetical protein
MNDRRTRRHVREQGSYSWDLGSVMVEIVIKISLDRVDTCSRKIMVRGSSRPDPKFLSTSRTGNAYPEINLQVPCAPKFPIPHLKRHCHFVVFVQLLVETFSPVSAQLDVMRSDAGKKTCECPKACREERGGIHGQTRLNPYGWRDDLET